MKLLSVRGPAAPYPAALIESPEGSWVLDLSQVLPGGTVTDLVADARAYQAAEALIEQADLSTLPALAEVELDPPVRPQNIFCVGHNFEGHLPAGVVSSADMAHPNVFVKTVNTINGPDDPVRLPPAATSTDYEGELAVVIGKEARNVPPGDGLAFIAGYTVVNDVSARDWQKRGSQWALGKCFDGFCPIGPALVTLDEAAGLSGRELTTMREGVVTQQVSLGRMIFTPAFLVEYLSQVTTLLPGDVIATGTPSKMPEATAQHVPLRDGDTVIVTVPGIGSLQTRFIDSH